ncbi:MAG: IclR family transcriptional regulator [Bacillota bacterium]
MKKNNDDKFFVQSVNRTFEILDCISKGKGAGKSLTEISKAIQLPVSTAYRLIQNLVAWNYVTESTDGNYSLGLKLLELGSLVQKNIEIRNLARPFMEQLNETTKETIYLAKFDEKDSTLIYIEKMESLRNVTLTAGVGTRNYVHSTANGKCLLSGFDDEKIRVILKRKGMPPLTGHTLVDIDAFLSDVQKVRQQGYAVDDEENEVSVRCVAAPIFDYTRRVAASISISGVSTNITPEQLRHEYRDLVIKTAQEISYELGFRD